MGPARSSLSGCGTLGSVPELSQNRGRADREELLLIRAIRSSTSQNCVKRKVAEFLPYELQCNCFLSEVGRRGYRPSLPAHPDRRRRCRGIAPAECLEHTGVEFS